MSADEKSLLVSAFNIGYVLTQLAGPWLATRIGFKRVLLISTLFSGILVRDHDIDKVKLSFVDSRISRYSENKRNNGHNLKNRRWSSLWPGHSSR